MQTEQADSRSRRDVAAAGDVPWRCKDFLFTSESVSEGHPDKMCDQISDAILDALLRAGSRQPRRLREPGQDRHGGGRRRDHDQRARSTTPRSCASTVRDIGYTSSDMGFDADTCAVLTAIDRQSPDISQGVTEGEGPAQGAGRRRPGPDVRLRVRRDAGADAAADHAGAPAGRAPRRRARAAASTRSCGRTPSRRSPSSTATASRRRVDAVVVSTQHSPDVKYETLREMVIEEVIKKVVPAQYLDQRTVFHVNPTGRFVVGGPLGDCGLTGRKIIVDTYGGYGRHGGGAFSGKDPEQGRPQRRLHGALHRQEHRRRRAGDASARCSSPTPSASPSRSRCWSTPSTPARCRTSASASSCASTSS